MNSYNRSLIALAIALVAVLMAGLWMRSRVVTANELSAKLEEMKAGIAEMSVNAEVALQLKQGLEKMRAEIRPITETFVGKDYEIHQLVMAVVSSAGKSGMEMVDASTQEAKSDTLNLQGLDRQVSRVFHEVRLTGSYSGLVRFLQGMDDWPMAAQISSMEVFPSARAARHSTSTGDESTGLDEIDVILNLAVFVLE